MKLGAFSISLIVKDIHASKQFYENLGFSVFGGNIDQKWVIMKNGNGLLQLGQRRAHAQLAWPNRLRLHRLRARLVVGGAWRACIVSDEHGESWMGGRYEEIVPDQRIVFTFAWADGRDQPGLETRVTITFEEHEGKTKQVFHQAPFLHEEARDSHVGGWNECFDKEQAYAEAQASTTEKGQPS